MSTTADTESAIENEAPAHEALRIWFEADKSRTYAGMARVLQVDPATVGSWCRTREPRRPSQVVHLFAIGMITGVPPYAWLTPEETQRIKDVSDGKFAIVFERPKRQAPLDDRQMHFDDILSPSAPHSEEAPFDPDALDDDDDGSAEDAPAPFDPDAFT